VAESARLEIACGETHRGFESHLLRIYIPDSPGHGLLGSSNKLEYG
jgi:hypothetical protein